MPKASVKRLIECKKEDLIKLVLDIEKYPEFVPFCFDAKVYENKNDGDLTKIIADLTIGKGPFKDTYKSDVVFDKKKDTSKSEASPSIFKSEEDLGATKNEDLALSKEPALMSRIMSYLSITDASRFSQVSKENKPMRSDLAKVAERITFKK